MKKPKVSVILTSFNHGRFVAQAIESVLAQTFGDFELIVWDDASGDDSWEIIQGYRDPRIRAFRNEEPRRAVHGVNKAIAELAKGRYVAMHHSDDAWEPGKLATQVAFLDSHPRVGAVFSNALAIDERGEALPDPEHFYSKVFAQPNRSRFEWLRHFFFEGNALCHPSALVRRSCYEECGGYRYGFAQVGDCDMWIRLCLRHSIHVLPEVLVRFRVHDSERNTSGSRPDSRIRWITESYRLLRNYLQVGSFEDMAAIFPEARAYRREAGFEPAFVLAMVALGKHPFHFTKLFGIELLFELVGDPARAARIKELYGFDYRDLIAITARHDVFSHEHAAALVRSLSESEARVSMLAGAAARREEDLARLQGSLAARVADVSHMHDAVADRDRDIAELRREAAGHERRTSELDGALAASAAELARLQREAAGLARDVAERDREAAALRGDLAGRDREAAALRGDLEERDREIAALRDAAATHARTAAALEDELAARERRIAELGAAVGARSADLDHMHKAVAERDARVGQLVQSQAALEARARDLEARLAKAEGTLAARATRLLRDGPDRALRYLRARRWRSELAGCPLMDADWYRASYPDIARKGLDPLVHYLAHGWREGRNPGPGFDGAYYLARHPDAGGVPPLLHYWRHGRFRSGHPSAEAESLARRQRRWHAQVKRCPLFDAEWYARKHPEAAACGEGPAWHYVTLGWTQGLQPGPEFDPAHYCGRYPDAAAAGLPPLLHYWRLGRFEGRPPNAALDFELLQANATVPGLDADTPLEFDASALASRDAPYMSVVIPTYNRVARLPGILESWRAVAKQTAFPFEILFSDDGSTDGSADYLEGVTDLPLRVLRNEHGGPSRARNAAIRAARGERVFIIGDDIYPDPGILNVHAALGQKLGRLIATLGVVDWHPDLRVNHLMHHITEVGNEQFSFNRFRDEALTDFRHFYTCNVCIDRGLALEEATIFDETFDRAAFEDVEFAYRLALRGLRLYYTSRARGTHYHPYEVAGFCRRQAGVGQMAVVFGELHPAADRALGLVPLARRARMGRRLAVTDAQWQERVDRLMARCKAYEAIVEAQLGAAGAGVRARLSAIYSRLFRAMYEFGALQRLARWRNPLSVAMSGHFGEDWNAYWKAIGRELPEPSGDGAEMREVAVAVERAPGAAALRTEAQRALAEELSKIPVPGSPAPSSPAAAQGLRPVLGLVVDEGDPGRDEAIARFRALWGGAGLVYERSPDGLLAAIAEDGTAAQPVTPEAAAASVFHWPCAPSSMLSRDHLLGAFMAVAENGIDLAFVSHSLAEGARVAGRSLRDQLVFSRGVATEVFEGRLDEAAFAGKVLRLLPAGGSVAERPLEEFLGTAVDFGADGEFRSRSREAPARAPCAAGYLPVRAKARPVVLVFPIFLAVGGVERNMVEIMRRLGQRFDFVVVSMERLRPEQGSLAGQAIEVASAVIEMPEIVGQPEFLRVLRRIREAWRPDLVWVCNGSPWFCDHAADIRGLFDDVPIVDQEVYDTRQGWIARYGEPGIRSFDYFVAINRKIERRFLEDFRIEPERARLIYSAIDARRIRQFKAEGADEGALRAKLGLPAAGRVFAFVARLTGQKRPLLFLELARRRLDRPGECFVLVGDGELAPQAERFIEEHGLRNVVRIPYLANTLELDRVADGIVFTSAFEGLPIAMLEALALGVPVFSTQAGDIEDIVRQYGCGDVVPVDAPAGEIASAFERWVAGLEGYRAAARRSEEAVLERFSSEAIALQHAELWTTAMSRYQRVAA